MEMAYRIYITDSLFYYAQQQRLTDRFTDRLKPEKVNTKDGADIAKEVMENIGLRFKT